MACDCNCDHIRYGNSPQIVHISYYGGYNGHVLTRNKLKFQFLNFCLNQWLTLLAEGGKTDYWTQRMSNSKSTAKQAQLKHLKLGYIRPALELEFPCLQIPHAKRTILAGLTDETNTCCWWGLWDSTFTIIFDRKVGIPYLCSLNHGQYCLLDSLNKIYKSFQQHLWSQTNCKDPYLLIAGSRCFLPKYSPEVKHWIRIKYFPSQLISHLMEPADKCTDLTRYLETGNTFFSFIHSHTSEK
jgi:hypothetical protein